MTRDLLIPPKEVFQDFGSQELKLNFIFNLFKIFILLIIFNCSSFSQTDDQHQESSIRNLKSSIQKITSDPFFEQTVIALDIFDLTDSISLFKQNEKLLLKPASNMKLITSIAGLMKLNASYQFKTDLYHTGIIEGRTLYGDLYVVGGFDPDFTTDDLDSLVRIIQSLGIKEIKGGVFGDVSMKDSLYWGKGWMWDDDPGSSEPYLSALNINRNCIKVFVEGSEIGSPAKVTLIPETDFVGVENNSVTVASNTSENFRITRDWVNRSNTILIDGEVRKSAYIDSSANTKEVNLLNPEKYFMTLFKEHLEKQGIIVDKEIGLQKVKDNSVYLTSIERDIDTVLSDLNKESDNLNAEMLIYAIALKDSGAPAHAYNGLTAIKELIDSLNLNPEDYFIADGSGLSHYNLISAELLLNALKYVYYQRKDLINLFYNSLAIAGVDGKLKKRMKSSVATGNVHAKTGTLKGVSNLSGYVTAKNGHLIAFSIMIQNFVDKYSYARSLQDEICKLLAEYK
ncbi:MAG: D-alanyl-D-alanine carboxypeptidase/D-alanyl-D-alanine-endopeptidase [Ignavibacteriaceae bacterium]